MAALPYGRQTIEADDIAAVTEALSADFLTTGPKVEEFERSFAKRVGAAHAVACNSGTAALHLAMLGLSVGTGDVVIVPSITFLATANTAVLCGARVVFADVDSDSGLMTAETLNAALARAGGPVKAVVPVHLRGEACDLAAIGAVARQAGAVVIEDAAHALGSEGVGSGGAACFSFHPVKTITTGEGGMVSTDDASLAERMRSLRSHGMTRPPGGDPWVYEMAQVGLNYRLPDINCALGLSQLAKLNRFIERRRALARQYEALLAPLSPLVTLAAGPNWPGAAPHLVSVLIDFEAAGVNRRQVCDELKSRGVGAQVHYIPVHTQPFYRAQQPDLRLPGAEAYYARTLSLPLFPAMADEDVDRVVDALAGALRR